jgi:hypothetical protein
MYPNKGSYLYLYLYWISMSISSPYAACQSSRQEVARPPRSVIFALPIPLPNTSEIVRLSSCLEMS